MRAVETCNELCKVPEEQIIFMECLAGEVCVPGANCCEQRCCYDSYDVCLTSCEEYGQAAYNIAYEGYCSFPLVNCSTWSGNFTCNSKGVSADYCAMLQCNKNSVCTRCL